MRWTALTAMSLVAVPLLCSVAPAPAKAATPSGPPSGFSVRILRSMDAGNPKPVVGIDVLVCDPKTQRCSQVATTDARGIARFEGVTDPVVSVRTMLSRCPEATARIDLATINPKKPIDIVFPPAGFVSIRLLEATAAGSRQTVDAPQVEALLTPVAGAAPDGEGAVSEIRVTMPLTRSGVLSLCVNAGVAFDIRLAVPGYAAATLEGVKVGVGESAEREARLSKSPGP